MTGEATVPASPTGQIMMVLEVKNQLKQVAEKTALVDDQNKPIGIRLNKSRQRSVFVTATDITVTKANLL